MMHGAGLFVPPLLLVKTYAPCKIAGVLYATRNRLPEYEKLQQSGLAKHRGSLGRPRLGTCPCPAPWQRPRIPCRSSACSTTNLSRITCHDA